jgi:hypothetical protein
MDEVIKPLDREIALLLIATLDKQAIIDGLIRMLRDKQAIIENYEQRFAELDSELFGN